MGTFGLVLLWVGSVVFGALIGCLVGYVIWKLGFELLGSAAVLVGAGVGGIATFLGILAWSDRRDQQRRTNH